MAIAVSKPHRKMPSGEGSPTRTSRASSADLATVVPALFAAIVIVIRAAHQSITIDEANNWILFVRDGQATVWTPSSGNHLLYSLLELLSTTVFGVHAFTLRMPALLGAALYLRSTAGLIRMLLPDRTVRLVFAVVLMLNPLILDYLIAARGYSLGLGFLTTALWLAAGLVLDEPAGRATGSVLRPAALASTCLGLTVCANFSYAVAAAVLGASLLVIVAVRQRLSRAHTGRLAAATVLPGAVVIFLIAGYTITHWPSGQFVYGATSLGQVITSVVDPSLWQPNPNLLQPQLLTVAHKLVDVYPYLFALLLLAGAGGAVWAVRRRPSAHLAVALLTWETAAITLLIHVLLRATTGLLLPEARTAAFLVPLVLVGLAALIGGGALGGGLVSLNSPRKGHPGRWLATAAVGLLAVLTLSCLRLSYFELWSWDADVAPASKVIAATDRTQHLGQPEIYWMYFASLNFYRGAAGLPLYTDQANAPSYQPGRRLYVLYLPSSYTFMREHHLTTIDSWSQSGMVIAEGR